MSDTFRCVLAAALLWPALATAQITPQPAARHERTQGMLLGSLIGDAVGGPVEFKSNEELSAVLPNLRACSPEEFRQVARDTTRRSTLRCLPYTALRPDVAPYGPWEMKAKPGTVTDDSRHKMILMHCLRRASESPGSSVQVADLSRAYVEYFQQARWSPAYRQLAKESFREYDQAARWILGERDLAVALPPSRIWAGVANCSGQMAFLPLASLYPGKPNDAYRATFALSFVDTGQAKDINSAMVAALATALAANHPNASDRWAAVRQTIRDTDPYRYADTPFAKRPATEWLDFAINAANDANGSPGKLYEQLENHGRPKYFWDAHFTYTSTWAFLHFADYDPEVAMLVSLAFGHDTDSVAQLVGALCGAVHGSGVFPKTSVEQVEARLKADYQESVTEWTDVLGKLRNETRFPHPIAFVETLK